MRRENGEIGGYNRCSGGQKSGRRREEKPRLGAWVLTGERVDKRASAAVAAAGGKAAGGGARECLRCESRASGKVVVIGAAALKRKRDSVCVVTGDNIDKRAVCGRCIGRQKHAQVSARERVLRCESRASGKVVLIGATAERGRIGGCARGFCGIGQKKRGAVK